MRAREFSFRRQGQVFGPIAIAPRFLQGSLSLIANAIAEIGICRQFDTPELPLRNYP
jgi:hypothetical protein